MKLRRRPDLLFILICLACMALAIWGLSTVPPCPVSICPP